MNRGMRFISGRLIKVVAVLLAFVQVLCVLPFSNLSVLGATVSYKINDGTGKLGYAATNNYWVAEFDVSTLTWTLGSGFITPKETLTLTNNSGYEATLYIKLASIADNSTMSGTQGFSGTITAGQEYSLVLGAGESAVLQYTGQRKNEKSAVFSRIELVPTTRQAKATANDASLGEATVSSETPQRGTSVTFTATPKDRCTFIRWEDATGNVISTDRAYTTVVGDSNTVELIAIFEELEKVSVNINMPFENRGTVSHGGVSYGASGAFLFDPNTNESKSFLAEPKQGYVFWGWLIGSVGAFSEGLVAASTDASYQVIIGDAHQHLTAVFLRANHFQATSAATAQGTASVDRGTAVLYETVTFTATPAAGYIFEGWYDEAGILYSASAVYAHKITTEHDLSLVARFRSLVSGDAVCALFSNTNSSTTSESTYADLQEGLNAAANSSTNKIVVLLKKVALSYNLVVPQGVTLVIPYSESDRGSKEILNSDALIGKPYGVSLEVPENFSVTVRGTLLVNAVQGLYKTYYSGSVVNTYGLVQLEGSIVVENGGTLKARGLITGTNGIVTAKSGSTVYQFLEFADWRGGSVSREIFKQMFPINTFYLQNIQVNLELLEGSQLKANYYVRVSSMNIGTSESDAVTLVSSDSEALFRIGSGGKVVFGYQKYDANGKAVSKSIIDLYGDVFARYTSININAILVNYNISTKDVPCPLSGGFDINVMEGAHLTLENQFRLLPGSTLTIREGGLATIASTGALLCYDLEDFEDDASTGFSYKGYRRLSGSSGASNTLYKETEDGRLIVNGTLIVEGGFYSSAGLDSDSDDAADNGNEAQSSSIRTSSSNGKIILRDTAKLSNISIYEYDYSTAAVAKVIFNGARGVMVGNEDVWSNFGSSITYYSNGSAWYTYAVQYQNSNGVPVENGTYYYIGEPSTLPAGPAVSAIPTKDGMYIYGGRSWGSAASGFLTNGCAAKIVQPAEATPIGLDSSLELEYRLNDYIWLNAKVYSPAAGTAKLVDANGTELADFSLVPLNNGYYYIIRKVTSTELVTPYTVYLQIDGLKTEALSVGFQAYKELIYSTADQATKDLLDAMLVYGEAAEDKFVGANSTTATVTKPNVSGAHTDMNLDRENVIITQDVHAYGYGVNLNFDNCIRFIYGLQLEGMTDAKWANVVQIGLIRADQTASNLFAEGSAAYVLYHNAGLAQNSANLPDFGLATNGTDATLSLDAVKAMWNNGTGILEISYDMLYEDYNTVYTYRPYVMFKVGDELIASYGEQFDYGLETYLANRIDNPKDSKEQNLLYATWNYMKAVKAWMA